MFSILTSDMCQSEIQTYITATPFPDQLGADYVKTYWNEEVKHKPETLPICKVRLPPLAKSVKGNLVKI